MRAVDEMARRLLKLQQALEHPALEAAVRAERKAWRDRQANRLGRFKTRPLAAQLSENDRALLSEAFEVEIAANDPEPSKQTVLLKKLRTGDLPFSYLDAVHNVVPGNKLDWKQNTMVAVLEAIKNEKCQPVLIDARQLAQACKQITVPQKRRGPKPAKTEEVAKAMRADIRDDRFTFVALSEMKQAALAHEYNCNRETARRALKLIAPEFETPANSDTK
jgi:hypothetical protein